MAREMKDSGIEWIGEMPKGWRVNTAFQVFVQVKNKNIDLQEKNLLSLSYGRIKKKSIDTVGGLLPQNFEGYNIVEEGDIVLRLTDLQNDQKSLRVGIVTERGIVTSAYCTIRAKDMSNRKYLYYYLHSFDIAKGFYGMGAGVRQSLNWDGLKWLKIIMPFFNEQYGIVAFLDEKCVELDNIFEKTRESIEEYKKLKQAVITQAVTKGVRGNREMKDSGVAWIGSIPIRWKLIPFRHVLKERQEKNSPIKSEERLSLSIDLGVTLYAEKTTNLDRFKDDFEQYKLAYEGDLVMNSMNMIVGATGVSDYFGCVSPVYYTFYDELEDHVTAKYCEYIFRSKTMLRVLYSLGKGIYAIVRGDDRVNTCRLKVSKEDLKSIIIPVPPVEEQREIVNYLKKKCLAIDELIAKKEQYLSEIENFKKSLIYEYVTGKKEVPQKYQA